MTASAAGVALLVAALAAPVGAKDALRNGVVRARLTSQAAPAFTLMVRAKLDRRGRPRTGYGVTVRAGRLTLRRWDKGEVVEIGPWVADEAAVAGLAEARDLELTVWMVSTHLSVRLVDRGRSAVLVRRTFSDNTYKKGRVKLVAEVGEVRSLTLDKATEVGPGGRPVAWKDLDHAGLYKDAEAVERIVRDLHARHPEVTSLVELGRTRKERPILALRIAGPGPDPPERRPSVLLNAGHHGKELLSIEFALDALTSLLDRGTHSAQAARWLAGLAIWVVPLVNPDGNMAYVHRAARHGRKNGEGVDLNRNYPFRWGALGERGSRSVKTSPWYRGPAPASEPETQAMMRLADQERFVASLSFHTNGTLILTPYTIDGVDNPEPDEALPLAQELAAAAGMQSIGRPYKVKRKMYSVDGTDQDWLRAAHGTVAFIVEGPHHNPTDPAVIAADLQGVRPIWMGLLDRVLTGPAARGRVRSAQGAETAAIVSLPGTRLRAGERWPSRCRDGLYVRLLPPSLAQGEPGRTQVSPTSSPLVDRVCPRPELCAEETLCRATRGQCPRAGPPECATR